MSWAVALLVMGGCEDCQLRLHSGAFEDVFGGSERVTVGSTGVEETSQASSSGEGTTMGELATVTTASGSTSGLSDLEWGVTIEDASVGMSDSSGSTGTVPGGFCGDGIVDAELGEECDDGNWEDLDDCNIECLASRYVFVTRKKFTGKMADMSVDELCGKAAMEGGLPPPEQNYRAWIAGDSPFSAPLYWFSGVGSLERLYRSPTHQPIAYGDEFPGQLLHPIDCDEYGDAIGAGLVWTNVNGGGGQSSGDSHCGGWSTALSGYGVVGLTSSKSSEWTDYTELDCGSVAHLYCFQVGD